MTTSRLPEITLTCRKSHTFQTRAHGGQGVDCPQCRATGNRVKVWVPKDRPRNAREVAELAAIDGPAPERAADLAAVQLAARWGSEPRWDGALRLAAGRPADACPQCEGPISWEPGRTLTYCQECRVAGLPAAVTDHYARQADRSAEIAVRSADPDSAALRAARVRLRAVAQRMTDTVGGWIDAFDPDGLSGGAERLALDYQAELAAYLPEIKAAGSEAELAEIGAEIVAITSRAASSGDIATIEQHRATVERQLEIAEREAQWAAESAQREREELAAERRAEIEREHQAVTAGRQQKALPGPRPQPGYADAIGTAVALIEHSRQQKAKALAERGACDFRHRKPAAAERLYGIQTTNWHGRATGDQLAQTKALRACAKHFDQASAWVESLQLPAGAMTCYWKLGS